MSSQGMSLNSSLARKVPRRNLARLRQQLGLDKPVYIQYVIFLKDATQGDFGRSLRTQQPALSEIRTALPITLQLSLCALLIASLIGIPAGILAARKQGSIFDSLSMSGVLIGVSMPIFWTGLILLIVFGGKLHWLPIGELLARGCDDQAHHWNATHRCGAHW